MSDTDSDENESFALPIISSTTLHDSDDIIIEKEVHAKNIQTKKTKVCEICEDSFVLQKELKDHYLHKHITLQFKHIANRYYYCCQICYESAQQRINQQNIPSVCNDETKSDDRLVRRPPTNVEDLIKAIVESGKREEKLSAAYEATFKCLPRATNFRSKISSRKEMNFMFRKWNECLYQDLSSTDTQSLEDSSLDSCNASYLYPSLNELVAHRRATHAELIELSPMGGCYEKAGYIPRSNWSRNRRRTKKKSDKNPKIDLTGKPHSCPFCGMAYYTLAELSGHQTRNHSDLICSDEETISCKKETDQKEACQVVCVLNPDYDFTTPASAPLLTESISEVPRKTLTTKETKITPLQLLRTPDYYRFNELNNVRLKQKYNACPLNAEGYTDCTKKFINSAYVLGHLKWAHANFYENLVAFKAKYGEDGCEMIRNSLEINLNAMISDPEFDNNKNDNSLKDDSSGANSNTCHKCNNINANLEPGEVLEPKHKPLTKDHFCVKCQIQFTGRRKLYMHVHEVHWDDYKVWSCPRCFFGNYYHKAHMLRHMSSTTHAYDYPYKCPICLKRFARHKGLKNHLVNVYYHRDPATKLNYVSKINEHNCSNYDTNVDDNVNEFYGCSLKYICHLCTPAEAFLPPGWTFAAYTIDINKALVALRRDMFQKRAKFEAQHLKYTGVQLTPLTKIGQATYAKPENNEPLDRQTFHRFFSPFSPITPPSFDPATITVEALAKFSPVSIVKFRRLKELIQHYISSHPEFDPRLVEDDGLPRQEEGPYSLGGPVKLLPPFLKYVKNEPQNY